MEQVEHEMVLQCSGNGRYLYDDIPGTPWNQGGVGNVLFAGVPLSTVLEKNDIKIDPQVKYVTAEGQDGPMGRERSRAQPPGGGRLREEHSRTEAQRRGPPRHTRRTVRLVTPGFFGTMQLKWLSAAAVRDCRVDVLLPRDRISSASVALKPGERFEIHAREQQADLGDPLMSYILKPEPGAKLEAGPVTVSGVAYNDG